MRYERLLLLVRPGNSEGMQAEESLIAGYIF